MYSDPALIRRHTVKVSLNDREAALVDAFCSFTGEQKASFLRDLILARATEVLHGGPKSGSAPITLERTPVDLLSA